MRLCVTRIVLLVGLAVAAGGTAARGEEFRLESWVYRGKEKAPVSESLTLFQRGVVYDFALPDLNEITIFDSDRAKFVMLDCERRVKTTLTTVELLEFVSNLKSDPKLAKQAALFDPKFKESFDAESKWLTLAGEPISYRAKLLDPKPTDSEVPQQYRRFADWYSRLNAAYKGNLHTLARVPLNRAIAERGSVPEEVELSIHGKVGRIDVRSRHLFNWTLSQTDLKRIDKANSGLADYQEISLSEFKQTPKVTTASKEK